MAEECGYWHRVLTYAYPRRVVLQAAALAGAASVAAACGSRKNTQSGRSSSAASQPGKPKYGGQFNSASKYDPATFEPSQKQNIAVQVLSLTNDSLLGFKSGADVKYDDVILRPALAERWEAPDGQTFTFHLRQGVRFADLPPVNGRELTPADVKWSVEYLSRTGPFKALPPSAVATLFQGLERVETPDSTTVVIHFAKPFVPFLVYAASQFNPVVAHEIFDQDGDFSKRTVGTGPWQLDSGASQKGSRWVFKKNPTYFQEGRPYIDQVNWLVLPDDATVDSAFQTKQVDTLDYNGLSNQTIQQTRKAHPEIIAYPFLSSQGGQIYMNLTRPPLNDARVRQALAFSIDRDEFLKTFSGGSGAWALAGSTPGFFTQDETKQILKYDPSAAKRLLAAAGYSAGVELEFIYPGTKYGQEHISKLELIQAQAKRAGIAVSLKSVDEQTEVKRRQSGDYQLDMTPQGGVWAGDLDGILYTVFSSSSASNFSRVNDPKLDSMLDAERSEADSAKRREMLRQTVRYIAERVYGLSLIYGTTYNLWWPYLKNYAPNTAFRWDPILESWISK